LYFHEFGFGLGSIVAPFFVTIFYSAFLFSSVCLLSLLSMFVPHSLSLSLFLSISLKPCNELIIIKMLEPWLVPPLQLLVDGKEKTTYSRIASGRF
jgi:hypothetical protein